MMLPIGLRDEMRLSTENCSIAWFKLAEFVARGERERALAVYRLLMHSWSDQAYALQLKGDLYAAFQDDDRAREAYLAAIILYEKSARPVEAAALYERIASFESCSSVTLYKMISLFESLHLSHKAALYRAQLTLFLVTSGHHDQARDVIVAAQDAEQIVLFHDTLSLRLLMLPVDVMQETTKTLLALLVTIDTELHAMPFLTQLALVDHDLYTFARTFFSLERPAKVYSVGPQG